MNTSLSGLRTKESEKLRADARLFASYEASRRDSSRFFNYTEAVASSSTGNTPDQEVKQHLASFVKDIKIQSFGCFICFKKPPSFEIIGYSENTLRVLNLEQRMAGLGWDTLLGHDVRTLFLFTFSDVTNPIFNPLLLSIENRPFYAIYHCIEQGIVIDLEPADQVPRYLHVSGAYECQRLGANAVRKLLSVGHEGIDGLCDALVGVLKDFIDYDRIMIYKFDEDGNGEVVSEFTKSGMEPYLGLHYPSTDIPLVARHLFKKNRVRMIVDSGAYPVGIVQSAELTKPLILIQSTLRAPHSCHAQFLRNMGCIASMVLPICPEDRNDRNATLWGLVACHKREPFYVPFPLREACVFIVKIFEQHLVLKLRLVDVATNFDAKKKLLKSQVLLNNLEFPFVLTQSPSIMNIVRCEGVAIVSNGVSQVVGLTPSPEQIQDIIKWLLSFIDDLTLWSTNSLATAGYPNAAVLGCICGLAIVRLQSTGDFFLWFRCEATKEVKWGKASQNLTDAADDATQLLQMNPIASFNAYQQVIKNKSLGWEHWELEAMRSAKLAASEKKISSVETEMTQLLEESPISIFVVDPTGGIISWNLKMAEFTGLVPSDVIGKSATELIHEGYRESFNEYLARALQGDAGNAIQLRLKGMGRESLLIVVNSYSLKNHKDVVLRVYILVQDLNEVEDVTSKLANMEQQVNNHLTCMEAECKKLAPTPL